MPQNVFENVADAHRILREITLLRLLKHPDIVEIKHIMLPDDPNTFKDLYVVFELMEVRNVARGDYEVEPPITDLSVCGKAIIYSLAHSKGTCIQEAIRHAPYALPSARQSVMRIITSSTWPGCF